MFLDLCLELGLQAFVLGRQLSQHFLGFKVFDIAFLLSFYLFFLLEQIMGSKRGPRALMSLMKTSQLLHQVFVSVV
jgi:hypothetical protein